MNDLISRQSAIDVEGLDEQIRCEMCRNPMHTNRGCDGNCKYDEKLYERIMQILGERIKPLPSAEPEIIRCRDCKHYTLEVGDDSYALGYCPFIGSHLVMSKGFCAWGERRT